MEGISKELLVECYHVATVLGNPIRAQVLSDLIAQCTDQWQTIEEFKASPVDGPCHVMYGSCIILLFFRKGEFYVSQGGTRLFLHTFRITHVRPIKTPDTPK